MRYIREIIALLKNPECGCVKDVRCMQDKLAEEGLKVTIETAAVWEATVPHENILAEGRLWFVDCENTALQLQKKQLPVVIYLHEGNQNCRFESATYAAEQPQELTADYFDLVYRRFQGIPWEIAQTQRCLIRETIPEDARAFARIYSDPEITRYTEGFGEAVSARVSGENPADVLSEGESESAAMLPEEEHIRSYIKKIYEFYGYGIWTVVLKETGEVIGRVGFQHFTEEVSGNTAEENPKYTHYPQLGYMIASAHQKQGFASEVCKAALTYAKDELFFEGIQIFMHKENAASIRLAEKLGFHWINQDMLLHGILEWKD